MSGSGFDNTLNKLIINKLYKSWSRTKSRLAYLKSLMKNLLFVLNKNC
jgi:hypothetical protein